MGGDDGPLLDYSLHFVRFILQLAVTRTSYKVSESCYLPAEAKLFNCQCFNTDEIIVIVFFQMMKMICKKIYPA